MSGVLTGFAVVAAIVLVGYLVGRSGVLGDQGQTVLARLVFFVGSPALLFSTLSEASVGQVFNTGLVVTASTSTAAVLLYAVVARFVWRRGIADTTLGGLSAGYVNAVNFGIPITSYVLGDITAIVPVLLFQLAVLAPIGLTVLDVAAAQQATGERRLRWSYALAPLRNPLVIASGVGLVVSVSGWTLPVVVADPIALLGGVSVPCLLMAFGMSLQGSTRPRLRVKELWLAVVVKVAVAPLMAWSLGTALGLRGAALAAVTVTAGLPTAQNIFGFAVRYGRAVALTRDTALVTTLLSVPALVVVAALLT